MKKPDELRFELVQFTCEEIADILRMSDNVRALSAKTRDRYLQSMLDGEWNCANGDVIVFDKQGHCIDGQHRLSAAYIYQQTRQELVWFWCVNNCETRAALTKDQGMIRTLSGLLKKDGVSMAIRCASIVCSQLRLQENGRHILSLRSTMSKSPLAVQYRCWLENMEDIKVYAHLAEKARGAKLSRATTFGQVLYEIHRQCGDVVQDFAHDVITGANLRETNPAFLLRKRLLADYAETRNKLTIDVVLSLMVMAWNHWIKGNSLTRLIWKGSGPNASSVPDIYVPTKEDLE